MISSSEDIAAVLADIVSDCASGSRADLQTRVWDTLGELGFDGIGVAEADGGSGGDLDDLVALVRSVGSHALSMPIAETALARWLSVAEPRIEPRSTTVAAVEGELEFRSGSVTGVIPEVPWTRVSSAVLLPWRERMAVVDLGHPAVRAIESTNVAGETRAELRLVNAPVAVIEDSSAVAVLRRYELLRLAQLTGLCEGAFSLTKNYVQTREQFGRALVRLPAVGRNLATLRVKLLEAEAALTRALNRHARTEQEFAGALLGARVIVSSSATEIAALTHQMHGAIGITQEYPLHEFTTRLWSWRDEPVSADRAATLLGGLVRSEPYFWDVLSS